MQYDVDKLDLLHLSSTRGKHASLLHFLGTANRGLPDMHYGVRGDLK